ncbi:platelet-activating factor acetylhydrolase 2, cytoplasmic isoform X2 [Bombina bombina]|nr:platelet-activating factor acetylhydrolase 2, cytoplasmic isoform X2 [Bombina bombina]
MLRNNNIIQSDAVKIHGQPMLPATWNDPFVSGKDRKPLIIFSHGLGGFRTIYSSLCMELASYGFLVAAIEHRDGSACASYYFSDMSNPIKVWIPLRKVIPGMKEFYFRNYQLHQRATECVRAVQILREIDIGKEVANMLQSGFVLQSLKDRIDFSRVAVMGHSFGGASAMLSLTKDDTFRCVVALDPWMGPLEDTAYPNIQKPVLIINSETFQTAQDVKKMMRLDTGDKEIKILTVLGSDHENQSDFAFLDVSLIDKSLFLRGTIDPQQCLEINVTTTLNFLQKHLDIAGKFPSLEDLNEDMRAHIFPGSPLLKSSKL